jgi:cytochrome b6-f complex iron-sulfur subunit
MSVEEKKKSRRQFLGISLGVLGTMFMGGVVYPILSYLVPPPKGKDNEIVKVLKSELPAGGMKRFHIREIPAVVINSKAGFAAFSLVCSHLGCLVKWEGDKNEFVCPCHGAKFDEAGKVISGPPPRGLDVLNVEDKGEEVWIS